MSKDQVSPEILTSIENKINDPLVKAYTLVELCSVYMTYKNIEDGEEVSKLLLSLYFIIDPENPKFNEFLFLLLERISAKHKYSVHHYWKVKKMKGDNSIKLTVKDIEEGLLSDLLEHKKIIESSWIPEGIPSPNDMIRLWEEFGSASKKGSLSQVELDEMFEQ
ncbi:hypothetical protein [Leptospira brenneri]|uniref:hypothetical protein n=1 Tax=Leptospira brenneri TaxID=2023182 RepID=UPI000CC85853|nr:hypothetical protein [Leptospira brenneri]PJZ44241.1 hypothetical protein CH361_16495 [Leptospira brenneri]